MEAIKGYQFRKWMQLREVINFARKLSKGVINFANGGNKGKLSILQWKQVREVINFEKFGN